MNFQWSLIFDAAWTVFWITTVFSYGSCFFVGLAAGIKTKGNTEVIEKTVDKFIISPLYVATFFCLVAILFFWKGSGLLHTAGNFTWIQMVVVAAMVFVGHILVEVVESTITKGKPLRLLEDAEAIQLLGVYLVILALVTVIAVLVK